MATRQDDERSEVDPSELFASVASATPAAPSARSQGVAAAGPSARVQSDAASGFTRADPAAKTGWGRGPVPVDTRKIRYDLNRAMTRPPLGFSASKVDRLDAKVAGDKLEGIHAMFGLVSESEERIWAFDCALWFEHAVNGGSTLQAERGVLTVDGVEFDLPSIVKFLGIDSRRFFRAFADDIAANNRRILANYDIYNPVSVEMWSQIMQVAVERGLQKYPYLCHDSSDAGNDLSVEERMALKASKRLVISSTFNAADAVTPRVAGDAGAMSAAAMREV